LPFACFDAWWKFVLENDIKIVDDYDRIMYDIYPYHALSPEMFKARVEKQKARDFTFTIVNNLDVVLQHELPPSIETFRWWHAVTALVLCDCLDKRLGLAGEEIIESRSSFIYEIV
jgi:hypothetical protein